MKSVQAETQVFRALADPTRRAIFEHLVLGERSVTELVGRFDVSQPAISQHLRALKRAGLARERRQGRYAYYRAEPAGLRPLVDWLAHYRTFWAEKLRKLETIVEEMDE